MITLSMILLLTAVILFVISGITRVRPSSVSLTDLGLAAFAASFLVELL